MSNLRPLDGVSSDVLFYRPCKRCQQGFFYCRREPGRRYCGEECAGEATEERVQKARQKYRDSPEGREQHRDEESERRQRHRLDRVGDRRLEPAHGELQIVATTAPFKRALKERDAKPDKSDGQLEWLLVVWPSLLTEAEGWLGLELACPVCGRKGIVGRVAGLDDWRGEDTS